jgi:hypothetical protein
MKYKCFKVALIVLKMNGLAQVVLPIKPEDP